MHNDDHYFHERRKKMSRMKKLNEHEIANYRSLNK